MSIDWSIRWQEKKPGAGELLALVQAYVSGSGDVVRERDGRIMVYLSGKASRALPPSLDWMSAHLPAPNSREIEIDEVTDGDVLVTVRQADEFTMVVAAGLAEVIARVWGAELTRPS